MSGLLAYSNRGESLPLPAALRRLAFLGGEEERLWTGENTAIAVTRKSWEMGEDFSGRVLLLESDDLVVAADASIYDRAALFQALSEAGFAARGPTSTHLIEAAYRAWGPLLVDHLIGDYAFVIWDRRLRRLLAARDPHGSRALYYSGSCGGVAVSSSSRALAELHGTCSDLNVECIAAQASGLAWSLGTDTCFRGVLNVRPGHRLLWQADRLVHERFWEPPRTPVADPWDAAEAAAALRSLLRTAAGERLGSGPTAVWMSGGWNSTAVFSAGQLALAPQDRHQLRPVSISFPPDDPRCEDELIRHAARRWKATVHWVRSDEIRLLDGLRSRAAVSDEPPPSLFESAHRALGQGSVATGARVALDGSGGSRLFAVSDIVLADLLRTGHWVEFLRFARSRRLDAAHLLETSVGPLLPEFVLRATEKVLGRRVRRHYLERPLMRWVRSPFVAEEGLLEREVSVLTSMRGNSFSQSESITQVTAPFGGFAASYVHRTLLEEGVELRSPLMDRRVVEFALSRPVKERASHEGTRLLLRRAMEGLVAAPVFAPRPSTAVPAAEFCRRQMVNAYPRLFSDLFGRPLRLAELGIVDPAALKVGADRFLSGGAGASLGAGLFRAINVELWLRGLDRSSIVSGSTIERGALELVPAA